MELSDDLRQFIREHADDDVRTLLLAAARYPGVDVPLAVIQIEAHRRIREKLPAWYAARDRLVFPSRTAVEQCSSEPTARYKQRLVGDDVRCLCDLTGGLGVDTAHFSACVPHVIYVERDRTLFEAAMRNFVRLGIGNVEGVNASAEEALEGGLPAVDVCYIDPSRRGAGDRRLFALADCEPNLERLLPVLLSKAPTVIAKLSPMLDLQHTLTRLPGTSDIHVLSVRNECKELLFVVRRGHTAPPRIHCINLTADGREQTLCFTPDEERTAPLRLAPSVAQYLYEPNAAILKAGAFRLVAARMGVDKLHVDSHLYTSAAEVADFPGRCFRVEEVMPFGRALCRTIARTVPRANLAVRGFPLTADALRRRLKVADGGDVYLFATTLSDGRRVVVRCVRIG